MIVTGCSETKTPHVFSESFSGGHVEIGIYSSAEETCAKTKYQWLTSFKILSRDGSGRGIIYEPCNISLTIENGDGGTQNQQQTLVATFVKAIGLLYILILTYSVLATNWKGPSFSGASQIASSTTVLE
jgi:hypothetical protein